jgi:hypothetical protein
MRPLSDLPLFDAREDFGAPKPLRGRIQYPDAPGFKAANGASQEAAAAIAPVSLGSASGPLAHALDLVTAAQVRS